jgi:hypothetical protein
MRGAVVDWSLFGCARKGHVTYAPDEPELRDRLMAPTAGGTAWRCLRCGPAAAAPLLRRGRELRDELIWTKRLFGARGGKQAYEARLRTESFIEVEQAALAAAAPDNAGSTPR